MPRGSRSHLREDRRHIQDRDVRVLRETVRTRLNLELAAEPSVVKIALEVKPDQVTFVPERRQELTTEGGLDVIGQRSRVEEAVGRCREAGIKVSLFIDPSRDQVEASAAMGASAVELHTGRYADAVGDAEVARELSALIGAGQAVLDAGMALHAGHGLDYANVAAIARIHGMAELNIGHAIVTRAVFVGFREAVASMKAAIEMAPRLSFP